MTHHNSKTRAVIFGGVGFIGGNLAHHLLSSKAHVTVVDNLSRPGSEQNLRWLIGAFGHTGRLDVIRADIRDYSAVERALCGATVAYQLAAQVAVTRSVEDPKADFEINTLGTLNVLEAARRLKKPPVILFTSTNKVYGEMAERKVRRNGIRYYYSDGPGSGISEDQPLDFHSPYGCSKGAAEQYVRDYHRIYGLETVVFRMSCIYGPHQFGNEDQGWVAYFIISALSGRPITLYGDGRQVRDVLYIDDLVRAMRYATEKTHISAGQIYNVGGGPDNTLSLLELVNRINELAGETKVKYHFEDWRPGDQRIYVSDIRKIESALEWRPEVSVAEGIKRLFDWICANQVLFQKARKAGRAMIPWPAEESLVKAHKLA